MRDLKYLKVFKNVFLFLKRLDLYRGKNARSDPGHAREITSLGSFGNASVSHQKSWRRQVAEGLKFFAGPKTQIRECDFMNKCGIKTLSGYLKSSSRLKRERVFRYRLSFILACS